MEHKLNYTVICLVSDLLSSLLIDSLTPRSVRFLILKTSFIISRKISFDLVMVGEFYWVSIKIIPSSKYFT